MRHPRMARPLGAAIFLLLSLSGCASSQSSLDAAAKSCDRALDRLTADGCDQYVALAVQSKNADEIYRAYTWRALLREFREDLPGALADVDQAITTKPSQTFGHRRRAALIGESGDYRQALKLFADFETLNPTHAFDENLAMLHYVAGDRAKSVVLFQSAAVDYAENDQDENMAAILHFNAAIIESELDGGDVTPIAAQDVSARTQTMLPLLKRHRLGTMSDAELMERVDQMTGPAARENACDGYFSVGHRNVVAGDAAAARQAFRIAVERCSVVTFEHHAAQAWLKQLGT